MLRHSLTTEERETLEACLNVKKSRAYLLLNWQSPVTVTRRVTKFGLPKISISRLILKVTGPDMKGYEQVYISMEHVLFYFHDHFTGPPWRLRAANLLPLTTHTGSNPIMSYFPNTRFEIPLVRNSNFTKQNKRS